MLNKMDKKELKKIMTDAAAGHISKSEAEILIEQENVNPGASNEEKSSNKTQKRLIKSREVK